MQPSWEQAAAYVSALTGQPVETAELWFRCIHDSDKKVPAHKYYGTLASVWETLCRYNSEGWGIHANINAFPATAKTLNLADVWYVRAHAVDLDNTFSAQANYALIAASNPPPSFAVQSSPGKFHTYWIVQPYQDNERYETLQRKLHQLYDGDPGLIDPSRTLRMPGFYSHKYSAPGSDHYTAGAEPHLVTCWSLPGYGNPSTVEALEAAYQYVNVIHGGGGRNDLGNPELAAPSLDWLHFALYQMDPNTMSRGEWISATAAFKQSGWTHADEATLFNIWSEWCGRYTGNDVGENLKQWNSIRNTEVGWKSITRRVPTLIAYERFGFKDKAPAPSATIPTIAVPDTNMQAVPTADVPDMQFGEILTEQDCSHYFKNCFFIEKTGEILTPRGRFMNATQFNGTYGGKVFIIDAQGKVSDEPWKAALRSTLWTVPKVDHIRFLPELKTFEIVEDQLGRRGVNTYIPIRLKSSPGDVTPFLQHMAHMLPVENDRHIFLSYLAHNVKFPGFKIPWAPLLQSAEGVGKGFIQAVIEGMLGEMYTYSPPAEELVKSGSTFNGWQRGKLMIVVNEIKIDERRELIEIMKPWVSDKRIQIQAKGDNQEMEDNPANWVFFSNYKDAIPINQSGRRYSIFYSVIQSAGDLLLRGMNDDYFKALWHWLENGGQEHIVHWLLNYPIERGGIPMRAPQTSSYAEAVKVSRGPVEVAIANAVEDQLPGFRGGYVSVLAVIARLRALGGRLPAVATVERILSSMGYYDIGRAPRAYGQESMHEKAHLFAVTDALPASGYGRVQGYEG